MGNTELSFHPYKDRRLTIWLPSFATSSPARGLDNTKAPSSNRAAASGGGIGLRLHRRVNRVGNPRRRKRDESVALQLVVTSPRSGPSGLEILESAHDT